MFTLAIIVTSSGVVKGLMATVAVLLGLVIGPIVATPGRRGLQPGGQSDGSA